MLPIDRRTFLRLLGSAALTSSLTKSIERALADVFTICDGYHCSLLGPTDHFRGSVARSAAVDLDVDVHYDVHDYALVLRITNQAQAPCRVRIESTYDDESVVNVLPRGRAIEKRRPLKSTFGWYDLSVKADADPSFL
jgi:hypothetical protein